jgi:hypothetical protein
MSKCRMSCCAVRIGTLARAGEVPNVVRGACRSTRRPRSSLRYAGPATAGVEQADQVGGDVNSGSSGRRPAIRRRR